MEQLEQVIKQFINISDAEFYKLRQKCTIKNFKKHEIISVPETFINEAYFINNGLIRIVATDQDAIEHTVHFGLENQFIADYPSFLLKQAAIYTLQAIENSEVIVLSRDTINWAYTNLKEGEKLGRLIAEYYFIFQDGRVKNLYTRNPKQRYDSINELFPNIHNRVPQRMIASYLGISPVHLSRLKKSDHGKM